MALCQTCGGPDHLRCNCVIEPYCDQCDENDACNSEMDSACVIYHPTYPGQTPLPSQLTTLGLPNGSSAQTIFEAIDDYLGDNVNTPMSPIDTNSIDLTVTGHSIQADLKISPDTNNQLSIHGNGAYAAPYNDLFQVKVDVTAPPRYLADSLFGGTDGCVSIDVLDVGGLVQIQPFLDLQCLADRICAADGALKLQLGACLFGPTFDVLDTNSIDMNLASVGGQFILSANSKISATGGNTITINPDGLYSTGGTTVTADNGLTETSSNIQLGGPLIQDTDIDFNNAFQLSFINNPLISIGTSNPLTSSTLYVEDITLASSRVVVANFLKQTNLTPNVSSVTSENYLHLSGTTVVDTGVIKHVDAVDAQLKVDYTGTITLDAAMESSYAGLYCTVIKSNTGNVTGNTLTSGYFGGYASGTGNVTSMAGILVNGLSTDPSGPAYSGTVTNYYGIRVNAVNTSSNAAHVTNNFGVYVAGTGGTITNVAEVAFTTPSDIRLKENIVDISYGLSEIEKLRVVGFNYKSDVVISKQIGFIAQEVESIIPESIKKLNINGLENLMILDKDMIFAVLVNAIKELSAKVTALENK